MKKNCEKCGGEIVGESFYHNWFEVECCEECYIDLSVELNCDND